MSKQPNNPKRNHHTLPRFYLSGFVIPKNEPHIWVYKKNQKYKPGKGKLTDNPHWESIKSAAVIRDYYADKNEEGDSDFETYENFLESLEKPANVIINKIKALKAITEEEKEIFSLYMVQMHRRVPTYRAGVKAAIPKAIATFETSEELLKRVNRPNILDPKAYLKHLLDRIAAESQVENRTHLKIIAATYQSQLIPVIKNMRWRFFIAPQNQSFLTGDNPMFFFKGMGLKKPNSELSFPVSAEVALVASWHQGFADGNFVKGSTQIVKELNRRTASQTAKYLYSPENEEWIVKLLNKTEWQFNSIR
jgi:hypothetical protein